MGTISSDSIRAAFLEFFEKKSHRRITGSSLIPANDPTLLFINSGMAPLKKYFTGEAQPPHPDLCNVQTCLRTRDIDDVGDRHHLTFFEMLGSWSIGNYFKDRAVELAFELLTNGLGLDPARLYVTVFAGEPSLGLPPDEQSAAAWERAGIPRDRIVALGMADNFWGPAGDSGPCGPCTEVFIDTGDTFGVPYVPGGHFDTVNRYIEIWNAGVFMQFDKGLDGTYKPLPFTSVDTGSGLERLTLALNGHPTVYDTDLMTPIVSAVQSAFGEAGAPVQHHHRMAADHLRAATFVLADGVMPGNEGRGYIPRRLLRKCIAVATRRGVARFDAESVIEAVIGRMAGYYPYLMDRKDAIMAGVAQEQADFGRVLRRGMDQLDTLIAEPTTISGADAFRLFATYGLPVEITRDLAGERGSNVDLDGFAAEFANHQQASRKQTDTGKSRRLRRDDVLPAGFPACVEDTFLGYQQTTTDAAVLGVFRGGVPVDVARAGDEIDMITDHTPFYAEGGGQVGDRGVATTASGTRLEITDTVRHASGHHLHRATVTAGELHHGEQISLAVDATARAATAANHSATHLLNAALRRVLGKHVRQAGSLVDPARLRFDFTHPQAVTAEQLREIEGMVNAQVLSDLPRQVTVIDSADAATSGALYLEGEEYGEKVRVISFGGFSKEFCGGTHVTSTAQIGLLRITAEGSAAAGVRRINAVTRDAALRWVYEREDILVEAAGLLKASPAQLVERVRKLNDQARHRPASTATSAATAVDALTITLLGPWRLICAEVDADAGTLRASAQKAANEHNALVVFWSTDGDKARLVVSVPPAYQDRLDATELIRGLSKRLGGSGGGSAAIAQGGGGRPPRDGEVTEALSALLSTAV
ncbi:alanine--tRNA ligase [Actinoplanes sp. NPDC051475]|uniref:alanine--tRNA ligase n=1 Tax=Actinoplanes sp. NPDC051475 TaxID=3157225 RepID=UPI00344D0CF9